MTQYILAIDQGTTSTRCILFDRSSHLLASTQCEHQQIYPQPGWVEHDPLEIWRNTELLIAKLLEKTGLQRIDIAAIGITNQRETIVVWDRVSGKPLFNSIVWQDTRTSDLCERLAESSGRDQWRSITGLPIATYFSGPKLQWLLNSDPSLRRRIIEGDVLCGTIDTWLIWNLTGGMHVTDPTNASRTLLMNLETLNWDDRLLSAMDIPRDWLPEIRTSSEIYGHAKGLLEGVPVAGNLGDQQAALFGQTCFEVGQLKNTYGTGCFMLLNTGERPHASNHGLLTTVAYKLPNQPPIYALEGSVAVAGSLIQWIRDNLGLIKASNDIEPLAKSVQDNGGVYIVPAFSGLFAPYWRDDARGVITGLTAYANKGHIARAALEATAFQSAELLHALREDTQSGIFQLNVDGGMVINHTLMQFQADLLNMRVIRPKVLETTALGAAYIAGLAVGYWSNLDELKDLNQIDHIWEPQMEGDRRTKLMRAWTKAVERSFDWVE